MNVPQFSALLFLLGVVGIICWLVIPPMFNTLTMTHASIPYSAAVIVVVMLPIFLAVFTGLAFYILKRD